MKHIKIICAIATAALLTGCADEAVSSATTQTTAQTTTTAETTIQTTTAATTTTATTAETTVTEATTTTAEDVIVEPAETIPAIEDAKQPEESQKTPDGKYTLADTDLINTDGTYTQVDFEPENIPTWSATNPNKDWSRMSEKYTSNPSKIPYSEITLENAAEAFPFLGYTGKYPNYIEILPTDDIATIKNKVYQNMIGSESTKYGKGSDLWQYHNFKSQAEYDAYLVEQERLAAESEAFGAEVEAGRQEIVNGEASIGGHTPDSVIEDLFSEYN